MTEQKSYKVIGYWMSEKKSQKLNWSEFHGVCRNHGFHLVKLDLNRPLEEQGPFTVILHKLTDIIVLAKQGDPKAQKMISHVETYIREHPEVAVIDPLDNVHKLLDRYRTYSLIQNSELEEADVVTSSFVELMSNDVRQNTETLKQAGVKYPFVCKPSVAHGSSNAHKMALIFNERGVKDCRPPCVAQSFINHNAVLYKVYVVGEEYFVVERPSLKNFSPSDCDTIFFDSSDVSKADSTSSLCILDPKEQSVARVRPEPTRLKKIVSTLRKELGMSLMGIDVVIENGSGRYGIIDINAYPGYDGYPHFFDSLMTCILETVNNCSPNNEVVHTSRHEFSLPLSKNVGGGKNMDYISPGSADQDDSGFDTGDSSDEKKKRDLSVNSFTSGSRRSSTLSPCEGGDVEHVWYHEFSSITDLPIPTKRVVSNQHWCPDNLEP